MSGGLKSRRKRSEACGDVVEEDGFAFLRKSHGPANVPPVRPLGRPFRTHPQIENEQPPAGVTHFLVEEDGFEPSKAKPADLQSVPFGNLGTPPFSVGRKKGGAGGRIRTPDLLITNQLLYQLSYTSLNHGIYIPLYSKAGVVLNNPRFFTSLSDLIILS